MQENSPLKTKKELNHVYKSDFKYTHDNPYHDKLKAFEEFVILDNDAEQFSGKWNELIFKNSRPIHLEIGTGFGKFMSEYCQNNPEINFVGLDFRFKRSFKLAKKLEQVIHKNFRYLRAKGERIGFMFGPKEVEKIFYFFPDPWPKLRHHKKRLFQKPFLDMAHQVLTDKGEILVKTDHDGYFDWMMEEVKKEQQTLNRFELVMHSYDLRVEIPNHFLASFETEFETLFLKKGIKIKAMVLRKI